MRVIFQSTTFNNELYLFVLIGTSEVVDFFFFFLNLAFFFFFASSLILLNNTFTTFIFCVLKNTQPLITFWKRFCICELGLLKPIIPTNLGSFISNFIVTQCISSPSVYVQFLLQRTSMWLRISVLYNNNACANWNSTCVFSLHKLILDCPFGVEGLSWHVPVGSSDQFVIPSLLCALPALRWWPCSDPGGTLGQGQVFHTHHTGTKELVLADPCLRGRGTEEQALQKFLLYTSKELSH